MELTKQQGVSRREAKGHLVIEIDDRLARFKGAKMRNLSRWEKRKFDNALFLENAYIKKPIKIFHYE